jgi:hypothetical protein
MRQRDFSSVVHRICSTALLLLCLPGSLAAADLCDSATDRPFTFNELAQGLAPGEQRCYATDLPSTGVWLVDVSVDLLEETKPALWISSEPCVRDEETEGPATQMLYRTADEALLRVLIPGRYLFCVSARDSERSLERHWITSLFAPQTTGDPDEDEPDPDPLSP